MFHEQRFACGGLSLHGAVGPESGLPLVMLHGVTRCWQDFLPVAGALSMRWRLFGIDQRGHGLSDRAPGNYLVTDYVGDAAHWLTHWLAAPAVLYGHSLGAMVAAAVAAEVPSLVRAVVLEDPPLESMGARIHEHGRDAFFASMQQAVTPGISVSQLASKLGDLPVVSPGNGRRERLRDVRDATSIRFSARCLLQSDPDVLTPVAAGRWLDGYDEEAVFSRIECPTLLLQGNPALGGLLTDDDAARLESMIPDVARVTMQRSGHLIHWSQTEETARLLIGFLESTRHRSTFPETRRVDASTREPGCLPGQAKSNVGPEGGKRIEVHEDGKRHHGHQKRPVG
jgi:pimeloyl-ACP methyl ester carboxylesterase